MTDRPTPTAGGSDADPERIAALLDGRLDATQRADLLARIEASPGAYEAFADALATLRDLEGAEPSVITDLRAHRRLIRPSIVGAALALAAGLAFAIVFARRSGSGDTGLPASGQLVSLAVSNAPSGPVSRAPWNETRGGRDGLSPAARSIRIGALSMDLSLLVAQRDSSSRAVSLEIASLLDEVPAGAPAASSFRLLDATARPSDVARIATIAEQAAGVDATRLGAWLEGARVAVLKRDPTFFSAAPVAEASRSLARMRVVPTAASDRFADLARALAGPKQDWSAAAADLDQLLILLGSAGSALR